MNVDAGTMAPTEYGFDPKKVGAWVSLTRLGMVKSLFWTMVEKST